MVVSVQVALSCRSEEVSPVTAVEQGVVPVAYRFVLGSWAEEDHCFIRFENGVFYLGTL